MKRKKDKLSSGSKAIRSIILDIIHASGASHIGSSFSVADILMAIYGCVDIDKIRNRQDDRDRVIVSKGHAAAALYAVLFKYGLLDKTLLNTYYKNGSLLSGHVSHFVPFVEHSTGALGHGLSVGVGVCIGLKSRNFSISRVYVVIGDGEMHEGSNWEACMLAGHLKLNNLCVLVDNNHLGGIGRTDECCSLKSLKKMFGSFGFTVFEADGHDEKAISSIIKETRGNTDKPVSIICRTVKGKGVSFMEEDNVWHYRPPNKEAYQKAAMELKEG